jgi:hypothetical protein
MEALTQDSNSLVCNLPAMSAEQRIRHEQAMRQFFAGAIQETRELPDGLAFRSDSANFMLAAEFISLERLCCTFFNFTLTIDAASSSFWLSIRGPDGVKALLQGGFGSRVKLQA